MIRKRTLIETRLRRYLLHESLSCDPSHDVECSSLSNQSDPKEIERSWSEWCEKLEEQTERIAWYFSQVDTLVDDRAEIQNVCTDSGIVCKQNTALTVAEHSTNTASDSWLMATENVCLAANQSDAERWPKVHSCVLVRPRSLMERMILAHSSTRLRDEKTTLTTTDFVWSTLTDPSRS